MLSKAKELLKQVYGYDEFRKGQEQIIGGILEGKDTLAVLPTGGGKSICYQIPALALEGTTIVISPLISLMKDQVDTLNRLGVPAAYLNSSLGAAEYRDIMRNAMMGEYKLLYVAPERLDAPMFASLAEQLTIPLIAIDEAHCVSQWGHDFRPSYRQLAGWIRSMANRPLVAAFTATATQEVADDITAMLDLHAPNVFVTGFARPNLALSVVTGADKRRFLLRFAEERREQSGIVYTATRKEAEQVHELLSKAGYAAGKYHGGLSDTERAQAQERFRFDDIRIMVATNAFGMGIDKPNVRYVLHWQMPGDIESYYQEAGRAGRDGEESECILLFEPQDIQIQRYLIEQGPGEDSRKSVQLAKLNHMANYSRTQRCLQQFIVDYFGESGAEPCGKCSSCLDKSELVERTAEAQKAMSCVGRMKGRFGVTMVAKVLKGSRDKRVLEFGLDKLSTYGLFRSWPEKEIADWLYWLAAEGYLKLSDGQYPTVSLTASALPVLEGKEPVMQRLRTSVRRQASEGRHYAMPVFEALREWRKEAAAQEGVPPFMLFFDATLKELADAMPQTEAELLQVKGIGAAKAAKYGENILAIMAQFAGGANGEGARRDAPYEPSHAPQARIRTAAAAPGAAAGEDGDTPSHLLSLRMFQSGMEPQQIAEARGLSRVTVEAHLIRGAEEGEELEWSRVIPPEFEQLILDAIRTVGQGKLKPIKEALPDQVEYFAIHGVMAKYGLKNAVQ
ncbi:DNA helicase RecQ [Paenibacillus protaetiae]|uniref:DNA helicase RecQ n=1 Tax=Paenibacillus protaetiae TaxID=2509456 RepID=A0A4P6EQ88_9BACL|nr:DNA helicase RecQ [Paenibacillus protaetiae]QAY65120.1 DNA helicase RecQ [Paenibacillus protaetiae]